jgi:hypothetical protein
VDPEAPVTDVATTEAASSTAGRWWARETRLGSYRYPLRAIGVTALAAVTTAVAGVVGLVSLLSS